MQLENCSGLKPTQGKEILPGGMNLIIADAERVNKTDITNQKDNSNHLVSVTINSLFHFVKIVSPWAHNEGVCNKGEHRVFTLFGLPWSGQVNQKFSVHFLWFLSLYD